MSYEAFRRTRAAPTSSRTWPPVSPRSEDGLTWTFQIKPGLMYAPPKDDTEITAQDFIRAMEREANPKANVGGYSFYYSVIEGFDDFGAGDAEEISGLSAPDTHTLEITTTTPVGDIGYRFAMGAASPIPPDEEGSVWAWPRATTATTVVSSWRRGRTCSRGPRPWTSPRTRRTRPRHRVTSRVGRSSSSGTRRGRRNRTSCVTRSRTRSGSGSAATTTTCTTRSPREPWTSWWTARCRPRRSGTTRPTPIFQDRINIYASDAVRYVSFNLAVPPFDDVNVRKAVNGRSTNRGSGS